MDNRILDKRQRQDGPERVSGVSDLSPMKNCSKIFRTLASSLKPRPSRAPHGTLAQPVSRGAVLLKFGMVPPLVKLTSAAYGFVSTCGR